MSTLFIKFFRFVNITQLIHPKFVNNGVKMFKKIFIDLCNQKNEAPSVVCRKVNITPATFSCWTDESIPRRATLQRIADYFGVTVDYLLGKEETPSPKKDENTVTLHGRDGTVIEGKLTDEQIELIKLMIKQQKK